jgi:hypothetical protein
MGLSCTHAGNIGAPNAEQWILLSSRRTSPLVFDRTQDNPALHVDTMLGFEVAQSTVSKYMLQGGSPSQTITS